MVQTSISSWLQRPKSTQQPQPQPSSQPLNSDSIDLTSTTSSRNSRPDEDAPSEQTRSILNSIPGDQPSTTSSPNAKVSRRRTPPLPPQITLCPPTESNLHAFRRLNSLLLPIPYPETFYSEILSDTTTSSITLIANWTPSPSPCPPSDSQPHRPTPTLIGGIRCRLLPPTTDLPGPTLYISTIGTLAPYRGHGVASALLATVTARAATRHGVGCVAAHVWEANADALEWYQRRGFEVVRREEAYYRRLRPSAALLIRKRVGVADLLEAGEG